MAPRLPRAADLFPSHTQGLGPRFPEGPVWSLLDPASPDGLRAQLLTAIDTADELIDRCTATGIDRLVLGDVH